MKSYVLALCFFWSVTAAASASDLKALYKRPTSVPYPEDNQYSKAREDLGEMLYFDPRLSGSGITSCASCHNPSFSWTDGMPRAVGHGHKVLGRKSPTILNLAWTPKLMWDGRFNSLEEQALGPIAAEVEMNMALDGEKGLVKKIKSIPGYQPLFAKAYPGEEITAQLIGKAIGLYERGVVSGKAPFDKFIEGNSKALTASAQRGFELFNGKANCAQCHSGWSFSDGSFHDIGVPGDDIGRGKFLKLKSQQFAFKTPGLRNIAQRAPYMHDGSESTLEQVIDFYDQGGRVKRESLSEMMKPLHLTTSQKSDLVAFLNSLTSVDKKVSFPILPL